MLCDVMWQTHQSLSNAQAIPANRRQKHAHQMVAELPARYYSEVSRPVVIDKCRAWTSPANVEMLRHYVTPQPKIVVLTRSANEIIKSFTSLFERNNRNDFYLSGMADEFNRNMISTQMAKDANDPNTFLFVEFEDLIADAKSQLNRIYDFLELERFAHDFNNVVNKNQENDSVYGLIGMHDVRSKVGRRNEVQQ